MRPKALVVLALWGCGGAALAAPTPTPPDVQGLLAGVPLHFERNDGQTDSRVRFLARGSGYGLYLTADEAVFALRTHSREARESTPEVVRWQLVGGNRSAEVQGEELLPGRANYLVGESSGWRTDVPLYRRVRYADVYPGVSLTYYGNQRQLEYDLELLPDADPRQIRFRIEGARSIRLDDEGRLRIRTKSGELVQHAPVVYQLVDGVREPVTARFRRFGKREIGFEVASYDQARPLVIDPKIDFSTYLGGTLDEEAADVALAGNAGDLEVYVVGTTVSTDFLPPLSIVNPGGRGRAGKDIFVVKMRHAAGALSVVYASYLGGDRDDEGVAIALESDGAAVVTAQTDSTDIYAPSTFGVRGGIDVWVAKLVNDGNNLVWASRLGGDKEDIPRGLFVDGARDVFLVGLTRSEGFPTTPTSDPPAIQTSLRGPQDGFFTVLVANASAMSYSTYLGGAATDEANGVVVRAGETYIVGTTDSDDFLRIDPFQPIIGGGAAGVNDAFVTAFSPVNLSRFPRWSTYLGGKFPDSGAGIEADSTGVYLVGTTESPDDFPLQNPYQGGLKGPNDAFVSKLQLDGQKLVFSTFLGGSGPESGHDVAVDSTGHVYATGTTFSADFPAPRPLPSPNDALQGLSDAFLTMFTPTGCALEYSTFLGGKADDASGGLAVLPTGSAVVVGRTTSNDLPVFPGPAALGFQGSIDAFATLVNEPDPGPDVQVTKTDSVDPVIAGNTLRYTVSLRNLDPLRPAHNIRLQDTLPPAAAVTFLSSTPGAPACTMTAQVVTCDFACLDAGQEIIVTIDVRVELPAFPQITNQAQILVPEDPNSSNDLVSVQTQVVVPADLSLTKTDLPDPVVLGQTFDYGLEVVNNGPGTATGILVQDTLPVGATFVSTLPPCSPPIGNVVSCNVGTLAPSGTANLVVTVRATGAGTITNHAQVSGTEPDPVPGNNNATAVTTVLVPGGAVQFFTVRSSNLENLLEWKNPVLGGTATVEIFRSIASPNCVFETSPSTGSPHFVDMVPVSGGYGSFVDNVSITNGVTYCYSIYVDIDGGGINFSSGRFNRGRPFDSLTGNVRWEFNIGTSSLAPIGNGIGIVHSVANDANLYAMVKGAALGGGLGGGRWPSTYLPYPITGPSQGRPGSVPVSPGPPNRATFLSSDDGRVYAIDSEHGGAGTDLWISAALGGGSGLLAPPSGSFTQFGATRDLIYVGSRAAGGSQFFGLRLADGTAGPPDGWVVTGASPDIIGPVSGQPAVDYVSHRVYFASRAFDGTNDNTVWCVDFETGSVLWKRAYGDVDAGLTLRGNHLYAATNDGRVLALNTLNGNLDWQFTIPAGEVAAKGYVVADLSTPTNIYFSTLTRVWSLRDDVTSFFLNWPGGVPLPGGIPGNSPSTPVYAPGALHVWVGGSDNRLHRLNVGDGSGFDSFLLGDPTIPTAVGSPTLDLGGGFVYVGTEAGRVYAIQP